MGSIAVEAVSMRFLLLCSASHRFQANALAPAGMTWEADTCLCSVDTGFRKHVITAIRCDRPQQLCHPNDAMSQASTAMSSLRWPVGKGMGSIAVEAVSIWFFLL